jgi:DNA-directed RNA polymerase subunit RPC12/RpoP
MEYETLVESASPCPACGSRHIVATVYVMTAYEQDLQVSPDGAVTPLTDPFRADERPTGEASFRCAACGYRWQR